MEAVLSNSNQSTQQVQTGLPATTSSPSPSPSTRIALDVASSVTSVPDAHRPDSDAPVVPLLAGAIDQGTSALAASFAAHLSLLTNSGRAEIDSSSAPMIWSDSSSKSSLSSSSASSISFFTTSFTTSFTSSFTSSGSKIKVEDVCLADLHYWKFRPGHQHEIFEMADKLIANGERLPALRCPENTFESKKAFFSYLCTNSLELFIYIRSSPESINDRDEIGKTLLHHAANIGIMLDSTRPIIFHQLLSSVPGINFNIKDKNGDTAVHYLGRYAGDKYCRNVFYNMLEAGLAHGFDCHSTDRHGHTVLHLVALHSCKYLVLDRDKDMTDLFTIFAKHRGSDLGKILDVPSVSGDTALQYCLKRGSVDEAIRLLATGAIAQCVPGSISPTDIAALKMDIERRLKLDDTEKRDSQKIACTEKLYQLLLELESPSQINLE